ncbi:MAG: 50S ribosomal protein L20 [Alphaproteobacteria bacterium]|jgi:large subunit ribosomal protein L20
MARVKRGVTKQARHKKILKLARGSRGRSKSTFRAAIQRVEKDLQYAYRDRRTRKRDFRGLWIQRINAATRLHGMTYSQFMNGLKKAEIALDRKVLAALAVTEPTAFEALVGRAREELAAAAK